MSKVNYTPLNGYVLIKQDDKVIEEEVTAGGIFVKSKDQVAKETKEVLRGEVIAVAEGITQVKVGDRVDWQPFRNTPTEIDGEVYQKVPFEELHGILND